MKKILKSRIFLVIITAIIVSSITGVIAYSYAAKDISYTPSDDSWNVKTVEDAIKDLYKNSNYTFGTPIYSSNQGYRINRTTSLDLNKGKYMVYVTSGFMSKPSNTPDSSRSGLSNNEITFSCDSCKYSKISGYFTAASATAKDQTGYNAHYIYTDIYTLEVLSTTDTVSASHSVPTATWATSQIMIGAIPYNY